MLEAKTVKPLSYCTVCGHANWMCTCGTVTCRANCTRCGLPAPEHRPEPIEPYDKWEDRPND